MNGAPLFCVCNCNNYKFLWDITVNKKYYQLGRDQTLTGENTQKTEICFVLDLHCNIEPKHGWFAQYGQVQPDINVVCWTLGVWKIITRYNKINLDICHHKSSSIL